jgi:hypothetical protein
MSSGGLTARQPSLVSADTFAENIKCFAGDNVILAARHERPGRGPVSLCDRFGFIYQHKAHFSFRGGAAGRQARHPKCYYALGIKTELDSFESQRKPWIQHRVPEYEGVICQINATGRLLLTVRQLQRTVQSAQKPADAERHHGGCVGLGFDGVSQYLLE